MISTINREKLKAQIAAATAKGQLTTTLEPKPIPAIPATVEEARMRKTSLRKTTHELVQLDFDCLSAVLGVELNQEISPLRLQNIINTRLTEMRADGTVDTIPEVVWQMLRGLEIVMEGGWQRHTPSPAIIRRKDDSTIVVSHASPAACTASMGRRGVQILLQETDQWSAEGNDLTLRGGMAAAFSVAQLNRIWGSTQRPFPPQVSQTVTA